MDKVNIELPTSLKQARQELQDFSILIAGEKSSGKTSLAAEFPGHFILEFEIGNARHITGNWVDINNWETYIAYRKLLQANPNYCKTLVIDGVHKWDEYALNFVRKKYKLGEMDQNNFDVWRTKREILIDELMALRQLPFNRIYLTHTEVKKDVDYRGNSISRLDTTMSGQLNELMLSDDIAVWGIILSDASGNRKLKIERDSFVNASNKFGSHFRWGGVKLKEIPLGNSPEQGYKNFIAAFNNSLNPETGVITNSQPVTKPKVVFNG